MEIKVTKKTDRELMLEACESTFAGKSKQSLASMYKSEHSPSRTQMFFIQCIDIPLFVSTHLLRHTIGSQPFALTHRDDRAGGGYDNESIAIKLREIVDRIKAGDNDARIEFDKELEFIREKTGRNTSTNLSMWINAQSLIDMAKLRLCNKASQETRIIFDLIRCEVGKADPELAQFMVRKCVYRGGLCGEQKCGYNFSEAFAIEMELYRSLFTSRQRGLILKDKTLDV